MNDHFNVQRTVRTHGLDVVAALVLAACLVTACTSDIPPDVPADAPRRGGAVRFVDVTRTSGIEFVHSTGYDGRYWWPEIIGGGCALLDFDGDGLEDIFFVNGGSLSPDSLANPDWNRPSNALYRNLGDGTFRDVATAAGVSGAHYGQGCAVADYDADGDLDIYVTNVGPNQLFRNEGDGTFTDVAASARVDFAGWSTSAAFGDLDQDGDLDLFVTTYGHWSPDTQIPCTSPKGEPDYCGPQAFASAPDVYYENLGDGRFDDATRRTGFSAAFGHGLGVTIADFDGDTRPDVYVANDSDANNLWLNQGNGEFHDEGLLSGSALNAVGIPEGSMGVTIADLENDGDWDLFMTHMTGETNTLYVNDGRGRFQDVTQLAGLGAPSTTFTGFGTLFFDAELDGDVDVFIANGGVIKDDDAARSAWPYDQRDQLYLNASGRFRELSVEEASWLDVSAVGRGAAFGDLDEDGDIDIVIANAGGPPRLLRNDSDRSGRRWIAFRLRSGGTNVEGIGAIVSVASRIGLRAQRVSRDGSYASASEPRVLYGLERAESAVEVGVRWPDGYEERWVQRELDRDVVLERGSGEAGTLDRTPAAGVAAPIASIDGETFDSRSASPAARVTSFEIPPLPSLDQVDPAVAERVRDAHAALRLRPDAAASWKDYGVSLYADAGSYAGAAAALRRAVELDPDDERSVYLLATCERWLGDAEATREHLARTIELAPDYAPPRLRLAEMDVDDRRLSEAERQYRTVLEKGPDHAAALEGLGRVQRLRGDLDASIATLQRSIELEPASRGAHYELGLAWRERGEVERARRSLDAASALQPAPIEDPWLNELSTGRGGDASLLAGAKQARLAGNLDKARALYAEYVERRPDDAIGWVNLAAVHRDLGDRREALAAAARAIELDPLRAETHALLGVLLSAEGRTPEAMGALREAVRINPSLAPAWYDQALLLLTLRRAPDAIDALDRYVTLRPDDPNGHLKLGEARLMAGQFEAARVDLEQALALDPSTAPAHFRLAGLALQRKDARAAIQHFEAALQTNPSWPEVHFGTGLAYRMLGDVARARTSFERAVALRPDSERFRRALEEIGQAEP